MFPDGRRTAGNSSIPRTGGEITIFSHVHIDGTNETQLTYAPENETEPEWSPDGRQIAYEVSTGVWDSKESQNTYELFVMNADGGNPRRLTENNLGDFSPRWSPDGSLLSFVSDRSAAKHWEIYVMNGDGTNVRRLTNTAGAETAINSAWRPGK